MTLFDAFNRPLENLRISVTDRCNFRCSYCMPADRFPQGYPFIPPADLLTFDEITRLARIFSALGVHKIRLTGGEPLMRPHLDQLIRQLAAIDGITDIALSTNGFLLPKMATALREAGLHRLNVSLDTLDEAIFRSINGDRASVADVIKGIEAAEAAGFTPIKLNVVVQRGLNDHTLIDLIEFFRQRDHVVRFIEYMDVGTLNGWNSERVVPTDELIERISRVILLEPLPPREVGEVARRYRPVDGKGELGFITAVSNPFCGDCNRLRLSAKGAIYGCLFANAGFDLRRFLRSDATDAEIARHITDFWHRRADRYSELRGAGEALEKVEMYHIGG